MKNILQAQAANIQISTQIFTGYFSEICKSILFISYIYYQLDCNRYINGIEIINVTILFGRNFSAIPYTVFAPFLSPNYN